MKKIEEQDPAEVSAFLVVAARLLQIKSAALLPRPSVRENHSDEIDPGEALAQQLREYKRFKELSGFIKEREDLGQHSFLRINTPRPNIEIKPDLTELTLETFLEAARDAFSVKMSRPLDSVIKMPKISIKDKIRLIVDWFYAHGSEKFQFKHMMKSTNRVEIVVSFLAMLELIKQRVITVEQEEIFGEIFLTHTEKLQDYELTDIEFKD